MFLIRKIGFSYLKLDFVSRHSSLRRDGLHSYFPCLVVLVLDSELLRVSRVQLLRQGSNNAGSGEVCRDSRCLRSAAATVCSVGMGLQ